MYSGALKIPAREMAVEEVMKQVLLDKGYYDTTGGGLTISGGECLSNGPFARALADAAKEQGIGIMIDTSGMSDYPLLPELSEEMIESSIRFMLENKLRKVTLLPYHEFGIYKYRNMAEDFVKFKTPTDERLYEIYQRFTEAGICAEIPGKILK